MTISKIFRKGFLIGVISTAITIASYVGVEHYSEKSPAEKVYIESTKEIETIDNKLSKIRTLEATYSYNSIDILLEKINKIKAENDSLTARKSILMADSQYVLGKASIENNDAARYNEMLSNLLQIPFVFGLIGMVTGYGIAAARAAANYTKKKSN